MYLVGCVTYLVLLLTIAVLHSTSYFLLLFLISVVPKYYNIFTGFDHGTTIRAVFGVLVQAGLLFSCRLVQFYPSRLRATNKRTERLFRDCLSIQKFPRSYRRSSQGVAFPGNWRFTMPDRQTKGLNDSYGTWRAKKLRCIPKWLLDIHS